MIMLLIWGFSSCNEPTNLQPEIINQTVFLNLTQNKNKQELMLLRTMDDQESIGPRIFLSDFWKYNIPGADINVSINNTYYQFEEDYYINYLKGYTNKGSLEIDPADTCRLIINTNSTIVKGKTVVPNGFDIMKPTSGEIFDIIESTSIEITWTKSNDAFGYYVTIYCDSTFEPPNDAWNGTYYETFFTNDTTQIIKNLFTFNGEATISVSALDKNMYSHLYGGQESAGLVGAYGYFGSSVLRNIKVKLINKVWD